MAVVRMRKRSLPVGQAENVGRWVVVVSLAISAAVSLFRLREALIEIWSIATNPVQVDYGEGLVLNYVALLAELGTYFTPSNEYPLVHGAYPPLFPLLALPFHLAFGPSLLNTRLLSLASAVCCLLFLGWLVHLATRSRVLTVMFPLILLSTWTFRFWSSLGRVDLLALALSTAGLCVFYRFAESNDRRRYLAFLLFILAWQAKQTAIAAPSAVFAWVLLHPQHRRQFPRYLAAYFVPLALLIGAEDLATRGEFIDHIFLQWRIHDFHWATVWGYYTGIYLSSTGFLTGFTLAALLVLRGNFASGRDWLLMLYVPINFILFASVGKEGSNVNYAIEPTLSVYLVSAFAIARVQRVDLVWVRPAGAVALAAFFLWNGALEHYEGFETFFRPPMTPRQVELLRHLVRNAPGDVLSSDMSEVVLAGRVNLLQPCDHARLYRKGKWNGQPLAQDCWKGRFPLVIWNLGGWGLTEFERCLETQYVPIRELFTELSDPWSPVVLRHRSWDVKPLLGRVAVIDRVQ